MSYNEDVKIFLDYFLSKNCNTDYAVMLSGPWGCGKTHFIKEYFRRIDESRGIRDPLLSGSNFYVSLFGVKSNSEITDQFFAQAHPKLSSKSFRLLGTTVSRAANVLVGSDVNSPSENKRIIQDLILNLDGRVLIFDDLERCAMPISDVMGFINGYVEHDKRKVIIVANEDDIPGDQMHECRRRKEKLIGKTLQVGSDPSTVLSSFVGKLGNSAASEIIQKESDAILRTFDSSEKHNFRSLRFILEDYDRLVTAVDARLQASPAAMTRVLLFMMAAGLEYRSGALTRDEMGDLPSLAFKSIVSEINKQEKSSDIIKAENLTERYAEVNWRDPVAPPAAIAKLFYTGVIDIHEINKSLSQHPLVVGYSETPAWRRLWSWTDLPRGEYLLAREELLGELKNFDTTHPGEILHTAGIIIQAAKFGDFFLEENASIVDFFRNYVENVRASGCLTPNVELFGRMGGGYAGLGYPESSSAEFNEIREIVAHATRLAFGEKMRAIASAFLSRIATDASAYSSLHEYGVDQGNYADAPFLHYIDVDEFAHAIVRNGSLDERLLACLSARYEFERHNHQLLEEYEWVRKLKESVVKLSDSIGAPHKRLLEIRSTHYFGKIDASLEAASGG